MHAQHAVGLQGERKSCRVPRAPLTLPLACSPTILAGAAKNDDCEVGAAGRKACKNCTCGRAEGEAPEVKLTKEMLENPTSGCGSVSHPYTC